MLKRISFSELSLYMACPFKRHLCYDLRMWEGKTAYTWFGTVLDDALGSLFQERKPLEEVISIVAERLSASSIQDPDVVASFAKLAEKRWKRDATAQRLTDDWISIATKHLDKLSQMLMPDGTIVIPGIPEPLLFRDYQTQLQAEGASIRFKGFVDLICQGAKTDKWYVIDIKTTGRPWDFRFPDVKLKTNQLLLYKNYFIELAQQGKLKRISAPAIIDPATVECWYLFLFRATSAKQEAVKIESKPASVNRSVRMIEGAGRRISQGFKQKTTDMKQCGWCHLQEKCWSGELDTFLNA
tara:strand:+ start:1204 stop:2097 length:894 start_codon:yes stop_codon:yes gene_type:complete